MAAGDTIVFTIRVETRSSDPVTIEDPPLAGLLLAGARENSAVDIASDGMRRVTTRVLRLVAAQPGAWSIGAARVVQGGMVATTPPIGVEVTGDPTTAPLSAEALRTMIAEAAPPEIENEVAVTLVVEPRVVTLGQQVDLLALAWFPREVRTRMRAPAAFENPRVGGVWSYRHPMPAGVVATRRVGGRTYDIFAQHETIFPLREGPLVLGPAAVSYSFPLTFSFLSREVRHVVQSDSAVISVRALPVVGRPSGFRGAAGSGLTLELEPSAFDLAVGEGRPFSVTLSGRGNVALWPEPEFRWPAGLRVYPGEVGVVVARTGVELEGNKTFRYLLVADSAGTYRVPPADYPYFDWRTGRYVALRTVGLEVMARAGTGRSLPTVAAPDVLDHAPFVLPVEPTKLPLWAGVLIALAPPVLVFGSRLRWRRRARGGRERARPAAAPKGTLAGLERHFAAALERLVPAAERQDGSELVAALRAAGIEAPRAVHVVRLRDRLRQAVYGGGQAPDADELLAEAREVLSGQLGERDTGQRTPWGTVIAIVLVTATGPPLVAQSVSGEALLRAGAYAAAVDSFAARALLDPDDPGHWYHLGVAWFALGSEERARVAWIRAARLAPRHRAIRRALARTGSTDPRSRSLMWVAPVTGGEAVLAAAVLWMVGWGMVAARRRGATTALLAIAVLAAAYGAFVAVRYRTPTAVVLDGATPLREAPYGSATPVDRLNAGAAVRVAGARGGWMLVEFGSRRGWVMRAEVVRL